MRAEFSRVSFFTTQGRVFERLTTIRRGLFPRLGQSRVKLIDVSRGVYYSEASFPSIIPIFVYLLKGKIEL